VKIMLLPRVAIRLAHLGWVIVSGMVALSWFLFRGGERSVDARIAWMQWMSRRFLTLLHCEVTVTGVLPTRGLIACNHLGYVDILVIGSLCPAIFVAKSDVKEWPVFGWLASRAGTIFISRKQPAKVVEQLRKMEGPLSKGYPVILFPEGTSSDGSSVLPFRSPLLESALRTGCSIMPAAIRYELSEGDVGREVAYWGDHSLIPHLLNLLSKKSFRASLACGSARELLSDRKSEAIFLHHEISELHRSSHDPRYIEPFHRVI